MTKTEQISGNGFSSFEDYEICVQNCNELDNKITKRTYEPLCRLGYFKGIMKNSRVLEDIINACRNKKKSQTIIIL